MAILLPASAVDAPQHLFAAYKNHDDVPEVLIVYSGVIRFNFAIGGSLTHEDLWSFVPYSDGTLQDFNGVGQLVVASGSLSVWNNPEEDVLSAVDRAVPIVDFQPALPHPPSTPDPEVVLLRVNLGAVNSRLMAVPYQVAVRVMPFAFPSGPDEHSVAKVKQIPGPAGFQRVAPGSTLPAP